MLNTGFKTGGVYSRCTGTSGTELGVTDFRTFGAKAIAGIGKLPDTVASRSIPIRLRRKSTTEKTERFRGRKVTAEGAKLRAQLEEWAGKSDHVLTEMELTPLNELSDRAFDVWEPLLAIADFAGGNWGERSREAAIALSSAAPNEDDFPRIRLLADNPTRHRHQPPDLFRRAREGLERTRRGPLGRLECRRRDQAGAGCEAAKTVRDHPALDT